MTNRLTIYNLSVCLETNDFILKNHISNFLDKYYTIKQKSFSGKGDDGEKVYASKIKDRNIWQLHTTQFIHLYQYLKEINYPFKLDEKIDNTDYKVVNTDFKARDNWVLKEKQIPVCEFLTENPVKSKLIPLVMGAGKAQPLHSRIKVPGGWTFMRDVKIGTIVTAKDGTSSKVIGVFPQGKTPVYKITFSDGRTCEASDEHLWKIYVFRNKTWKIVNTLELKRLSELKQSMVYIELNDSEKIEDNKLPLDPYLLGCLIGDGGLTRTPPTFSKYDKELIDKISKLLPNEVCLKHKSKCDYTIVRKTGSNFSNNQLSEILKEIGLYGKYSYEKTIPEQYLLSSHKQRLHLIQGLMDTDGTVDSHGTVSFSTTSYQLALQVQYLIRSIGGISALGYKNPTYIYKDQKLKGRPAYVVNIRHKKPSELFTLNRKKNKTNDDNQYSSTLKLRVDKVEYIGNQETQCIAIDHPEHLYITDNFIVTHNTAISLISIAQLKKRLAIVILPTFIDKWVFDICNVHEAMTKDVMVIQGSKSLAAIIGMAKEGELKHNYFIFSSRTLQDYISAYEEDPDSCVEIYGCSPIELMPLLGVGILLNDEAHMNFHSIFKILIYSNVEYQIGLSATLMSEDHTTRRVHKVVYPDKCVYGDNLLVKYADVYPIAYSMSEDYKRHIKTTNYGSNNYSHIAFEQSILRRDRYLHTYFKLIKTTIEDYYINDYKDKDKLIIFVSTVNLATKLTDYLKEHYPDKIVNRYCEDDEYDDLMSADIIVSTVISAGTGVDIPDLRVGIQTVSISSPVSNLQSFGRLRQLPDRDVKFCYLYCNNIPKQKQYHLKRVDLFSDRAANIIYRQSRVNFF